MATLLELANELIDYSLTRNLVDGRPLNFNQGDAHPHKDSTVIPPPPHGPFSTLPVNVADLVNFHEEMTSKINTTRTVGTLEVVDKQKQIQLQGQLDSKRDPIGGTPSGLTLTPIADPSNKGEIKAGEGHRFGNIYDNRSPTDFLFKSEGGQYRHEGFIGPLRNFDVFAIANWFKGVSREFGILPRANNNIGSGKVERSAESIVKGASFAATQFLLAALNPGDLEVGGTLNQVYNPLSLPSSLLPARVINPAGNITVAAATTDYETNVNIAAAAGSNSTLNTERLLLMRKGIYAKSEFAHAVSQTRLPDSGFIGEVSKPGKTANLETKGFPAASIEGQVDQEGLTSIIAKHSDMNINIYTPSSPYPNSAVSPLIDLIQGERPGQKQTAQQKKLNALFNTSKFPNLSLESVNPDFSKIYVWKAKANESLGIVTGPDIPDKLDVKIHTNENDQGLVPVNQEISDGEMYLPFMFQDLRQGLDDFLYFRAFIKPQSVSETFTPEWNSDRYFGRVDQVPTYQGTVRSISLAFDVVAWSSFDLKVMWQKLYKLQSMVYPTYDTKGFMEAGPIIRMRVGDLFASISDGNRGLPGYISSMDFSYDDDIWNVEEEEKVPRKVSVTLSFVVIHNGNPGIYKYQQATFGLSDTPESIRATEGFEGVTFGAGQFTGESGGRTSVKVSVSEIRKIFKSATGKKL